MEKTPQVPEMFSTINYNFTTIELDMALSSCRGKSAGPDGITYTMIRYLSADNRKRLLRIYNKLWVLRKFPLDWCKSKIIPIVKPNAAGYRPISLTNCLAKVSEKMVSNRRL